MIGYAFRDPDVESGRTCGRCLQPSHGDHLCADLVKRLERQKKAVEAIAGIIRQGRVMPIRTIEETALDILGYINGRDVGL